MATLMMLGSDHQQLGMVHADALGTRVGMAMSAGRFPKPYAAVDPNEDAALDFGIGLVPGVFAGSFLSSIAGRDFRIQSFNEQAAMPRYIVGACLMGFGAMLARQ